jgi:hypothetical protein
MTNVSAPSVILNRISGSFISNDTSKLTTLLLIHVANRNCCDIPLCFVTSTYTQKIDISTKRVYCNYLHLPHVATLTVTFTWLPSNTDPACICGANSHQTQTLPVYVVPIHIKHRLSVNVVPIHIFRNPHLHKMCTAEELLSFKNQA